MKKILFVGESWNIHETHLKGFDSVSLCRLETTSAKPVFETFEKAGIEFEYMPSHIAHYEFPDTQQKLTEYSAIVLSDIGSNTLMLDPVMMYEGERKPNRLNEVVKFVQSGGGLVMFGGYLSFSGIENKARYAMTPLADILPVQMLHYDDRVEHPEGICPKQVLDHPVLQGIEGDWPYFLGYNKLSAKPEAQEIMTIGADTFMAGMEVGEGRTFAFASDCTTHWGSKAFLAWEGYEKIFPNIIKWLVKEL